jgi:hypothetical protein
MANVNRKGFRPVKRKGDEFAGDCNLYFIPSTDGTAVFKGDVVKLAGSASADGYATVAQAGANDVPVGVVVGFRVDPTNLNLSGSYRAASTDRYVLVADDPDLICELQSDDVGGRIAATDVGLVAQIAVGAGSTTTGFSGMELDTSTKASAQTGYVLQIMGIVDRPDNDISSDNSKVLVKFNTHAYKAGAGFAGV